MASSSRTTAAPAGSQSNEGLDERDILSLQQAADGTMFAGTNHGVFYLTSLRGEWKPAAMINGPLPQVEQKPIAPVRTSAKAHSTTHPAAKRPAPAGIHKTVAPEHAIAQEKAPRIRAMEVAGDTWYAATDEGLFVSNDHGRKWYGSAVNGEMDLIAVSVVADGTVTLVSPKRLFLSHDQGKSWDESTVPQYVTGIYNLTSTPDNSLWMATREGALHSTDGGKTWEHTLGGLPPRNVFVVRYDPAGQRLLATAMHAHGVFESKDNGQTWQQTPDAGVSIRAALNYQGRILAASAYNGLLLQQAGSTAETAHVAGSDGNATNASQQ